MYQTIAATKANLPVALFVKNLIARFKLSFINKTHIDSTVDKLL